MRRRALPVVLLLTWLAMAIAAGAEPAPKPVYMVLPFENLSEAPSLDWLSSCLALSLGEYLRGLDAEVMEDEERAIQIEGRGIPSGARLTLASVLDLGRHMRERQGGVRPDRAVLGRFNVADGDLILSVRSIDLARERAGPWISREGRLKDLLDVQNHVAEELVREENVSGRGGHSLGRQPKDLPLLTFETYCRAMAETDSHQRLRQLRRAVREFPAYNRAAYQAAALLARSEHWDEAARMLDGATNDPQPYLVESDLLRATVALERRDPAAAEEAARRAVERHDSARGRVLLGRARLALGDVAAAAAELDRATALDPSDPGLEDLRRSIENPPPAPTGSGAASVQQ